MIRLVASSTTTTIEGRLPTDVYVGLDNELSHTVVGYNFSAKYQAGLWDGKHHCLRDNRFPTGLLSRVQEYLTTNDISYEVVDRRPVYEKGAWLLNRQGLDERAYQAEAAAALIQNKYGIARLPPRAGKTLIATMGLAQLGLAPAIILCARIELAYQTQSAMQAWLPLNKIGLAGDGVWEPGDVVVATIQSLMSAFGQKCNDLEEAVRVERDYTLQQDRLAVRRLVERARLVVVDECHRSASDSFAYVLKRMTQTEFRWGISATPFREDNRDIRMEAVLGPIVYAIGYSHLIAHGYLVPPRIHFIEMPSVGGADGRTYSAIYSERITHNDLRNDVIAVVARQLLARDRTILIVIRHIAHGHELLRRLKADGAILLTGQEKQSAVRAQVLADMRQRKARLVISTLFDEALDVPALDTVIIAAGGDSAIKAFQRLRALTPYPGKQFCTIVDFLDRGQYLGDHARNRMRLYESEPAFQVRTRSWREFAVG